MLLHWIAGRIRVRGICGILLRLVLVNIFLGSSAWRSGSLMPQIWRRNLTCAVADSSRRCNTLPGWLSTAWFSRPSHALLPHESRIAHRRLIQPCLPVRILRTAQRLLVLHIGQGGQGLWLHQPPLPACVATKPAVLHDDFLARHVQDALSKRTLPTMTVGQSSHILEKLRITLRPCVLSEPATLLLMYTKPLTCAL